MLSLHQDITQPCWQTHCDKDIQAHQRVHTDTHMHGGTSAHVSWMCQTPAAESTTFIQYLFSPPASTNQIRSAVHMLTVTKYIRIQTVFSATRWLIMFFHKVNVPHLTRLKSWNAKKFPVDSVRPRVWAVADLTSQSSLQAQNCLVMEGNKASSIIRSFVFVLWQVYSGSFRANTYTG